MKEFDMAFYNFFLKEERNFLTGKITSEEIVKEKDQPYCIGGIICFNLLGESTQENINELLPTTYIYLN